MITKILKIAQENPEGFTVKLPECEMVSKGYVVSFFETQNSHDIKGLKKCIEHAENNDSIVGGWYNTENLMFYFDSCKVFTDLEKAIQFGRENKQIAIFDLTNCREIKL